MVPCDVLYKGSTMWNDFYSAMTQLYTILKWNQTIIPAEPNNGSELKYLKGNMGSSN